MEQPNLTDTIRGEIYGLAIPALGAVLSDPLMSLIDTACVGQLGSVQLAALGPNVAIFNFIFLVFSFMGTATCNVLAGTAALENGNSGTPSTGSVILSHAVVTAAIVGSISMTLILALGPRLLALMGTTPDFAGPALTYLNIRALSAPAVMVIVVGQGACLGRQDSTTPLLIYAMAAAVNCVGDYFLTLKLRWGVAGAAWATLLAQLVAAVCFVWKLQGNSFRATPGKPLQSAVLGWHGWPSAVSLEPFLVLGTPLVMRSLLGMVAYTLLARAAALEGLMALAAHQVAMQLFWTLSYMPEPLSLAAQSLIARDIQLSPQRAGHVARYLTCVSVALGLALALLTVGITLLGGGLLSSDAGVLSVLRGVLPQSALSQVLCSVTVALDGVALGSGDYAYLPRAQLVNVFVVMVALWASRSLKLGLGGVWWTMTAFFAVRLLAHVLHVLSHWTTSVLGNGLKHD